MSNIKFELSEDRKTLLVLFPDVMEGISFDALALDKFIKTMGELRANMTPEIEKEYGLGKVCEEVLEPAWLTEPEKMQGRSLLHLRDPRYGWLHYMFSTEDADKLSSCLREQVEVAADSVKNKGFSN